MAIFVIEPIPLVLRTVIRISETSGSYHHLGSRGDARKTVRARSLPWCGEPVSGLLHARERKGGLSFGRIHAIRRS